MTKFAVKEPKVLVSLQSSLTSKTAGSFTVFVLWEAGELQEKNRENLKCKPLFSRYFICSSTEREAWFSAHYSEANRLDKLWSFSANIWPFFSRSSTPGTTHCTSVHHISMLLGNHKWPMRLMNYILPGWRIAYSSIFYYHYYYTFHFLLNPALLSPLLLLFDDRNNLSHLKVVHHSHF